MNWGGKIHPKCGHPFLGQTLACTRKKVSSALACMHFLSLLLAMGVMWLLQVPTT